MLSVHPPRPVAKVRHACKCGRTIEFPALGRSRCELCEADREARRALEAILATRDPLVVEQAAGWLQMMETDAAVFRSARGRRILDSAALRACEAVRTVRDPILPDEVDDFAGRD